MKHFKYYNKEDVLSITKIRRYETKLGERIQVISDSNNLEQSLQESTASFVIVGVPEDIGVKGNHGIGGADSAWMDIVNNPFFDCICMKTFSCTRKEVFYKLLGTLLPLQTILGAALN